MKHHDVSSECCAQSETPNNIIIGYTANGDAVSIPRPRHSESNHLFLFGMSGFGRTRLPADAIVQAVVVANEPDDVSEGGKW